MSIEAEKSYHFVICKQHDVAKATAVTSQFIKEIGFNAVMQTQIATAVSELGTNIVKYAGRGNISVGLIHQMGTPGIEIIAEDNGPGLSDRALSLTENYSTGRSLGLGLHGVKRLMDEFLMDSSDNCGTKIVARKWKV